jgi:hypothetical protein
VCIRLREKLFNAGPRNRKELGILGEDFCLCTGFLFGSVAAAICGTGRGLGGGPSSELGKAGALYESVESLTKSSRKFFREIEDKSREI